MRPAQPDPTAAPSPDPPAPPSAALQEAARAATARQGRGRATTHRRTLPLRVGTRGSPLALVQTRAFLTMLTRFCPLLRDMDAFQEHAMKTTGDIVQHTSLAEIGGKGLFAKEIHEALSDGRIDFAVHSLKDLETTLPPGLVLACTLRREDARDVLVLRPGLPAPSPDAPLDVLPRGGLIGTASVRRQAQLLHARPDLRTALIRGNVQTRLDKVSRRLFDGSLLALAGLRRLGMEDRADLILEPDVMVPAAGQGIVGVTVRESDVELRELLGAIENFEARAVSTAERALLFELDGSCRTPIGGYARLIPPAAGAPPQLTPQLRLTGLVARGDGSFLLRRSIAGAPSDAERLGRELGASLRADSPSDLFTA